MLVRFVACRWVLLDVAFCLFCLLFVLLGVVFWGCFLLCLDVLPSCGFWFGDGFVGFVVVCCAVCLRIALLLLFMVPLLALFWFGCCLSVVGACGLFIVAVFLLLFLWFAFCCF